MIWVAAAPALPPVAWVVRRGDADEAPLAPWLYGIPNRDLTAGITLRALMSHTAGIHADLGSPGLPQWNWDELPLPFDDMLFGWTWSATGSPCSYSQTKWVWQDANAGTNSDYANANYLLAEAVVRDATNSTGAERLFKVIFENVGLPDSSAYAPLPAELEQRAAWQHGQDGARLGRTLYPWTFAGGVYASAQDYARMMVLALTRAATIAASAG